MKKRKKKKKERQEKKLQTFIYSLYKMEESVLMVSFMCGINTLLKQTFKNGK